MTLQLGTAWWGFQEQTPSNYFHMASSLGLQHVELPFYEQIKTASHLMEHERWDYRTPTACTELLSLADRAGVDIVAGTANIPIARDIHHWQTESGRSTVEFGRATARRAIDIAANLDLDVLRIAEPNIDPDQRDAARSYMESVGHAMGDLGEYAADQAPGLELVIENYGLTAEHINWALDAADHPRVGTNYDPCNYHRLGVDPLESLRELGDRVSYCHLKDAIRDDSRDPVELFAESRWPPSLAVGDGEIEWGPILAELADTYDGYLSIEYEMADDVMAGTRRSIDHVLDAADDHGVEIAYGD